MIQAILSYQFVLNELDTGEVEPEFKPIYLEFNNEKFSNQNYENLITKSGIFSIFYQHTTSVHEITGEFKNFYSGRLKENPYRVISYFKQLSNGAQYITISLFSLSDEVTIFERLIKSMSQRLDKLFETLERAKRTNQLSLLTDLNEKIGKEIKFTIFQIERLSNLDKLQKSALVFSNEARLKILETLRERPVSKSEMREILEKLTDNPNVDLLLEPFLELNLIKRDWVKGKRDKYTGIVKSEGEFLFLTKDISLIRVPNLDLLEKLEGFNKYLYAKFKSRTIDFFSEYNPVKQTNEETQQLANLLLDPDIYDNLVLMRNKFYPINKIPKIFSEFADTQEILKKLENLNIVTKIEDENNRPWLFLLSEIKPLIYFPEYLLKRIRKIYKKDGSPENISFEVAKKAYELLEIAYPEKVEF